MVTHIRGPKADPGSYLKNKQKDKYQCQVMVCENIFLKMQVKILSRTVQYSSDHTIKQTNKQAKQQNVRLLVDEYQDNISLRLIELITLLHS